MITDPAAAAVRATKDVDAIVAVTSRADYRGLGKQLMSRDFTQSLKDGDPPYRWTYEGMKLDVMPTDETILGFSNRWYVPALQTAITIELRGRLSIRLVAPAHFVATKLAAFLDRGKGDYLGSHDLEDVLSVVDGRPELVDEIADAEPELKTFVAEIIHNLIEDEHFVDRLPALILDGSPAERTSIVLERLKKLVRAAG